jgi:hypothetical protein
MEHVKSQPQRAPNGQELDSLSLTVVIIIHRIKVEPTIYTDAKA